MHTHHATPNCIYGIAQSIRGSIPIICRGPLEMAVNVFLKVVSIYHTESSALRVFKIAFHRSVDSHLSTRWVDTHLEYCRAVSKSNSGLRSAVGYCESVRCLVQSLIKPCAVSAKSLSPTLSQTHCMPGAEQTDSQDPGPRRIRTAAKVARLMAVNLPWCSQLICRKRQHRVYTNAPR